MDKPPVTCAQIKATVKPFLDDMLTEEEYAVVAAHLDRCHACRSYMRSIGALSNQVWALGEVPVPADLTATILFDLEHPPAPALQPARRRAGRRIALTFTIIAALLTAGVAASFFGGKIIRDRMNRGEHPSATTIAPPSSRQETAELIAELKGIRQALEETRAGHLTAAADTPTGVVAAESRAAAGDGTTAPAADTSVRLPEPAAEAATHRLHWHLIYTDEPERRRFADALGRLRITPEYRTPDLVLFRTTGEKIDTLMRQTAAFSDQKMPILNFTADTPIVADAEYLASVCFENPKEARPRSLHWHIGLVFAAQKERVAATVRSAGGSTEYLTEELAHVAVPESEIETIRRHIRIMGATLSESKRPEGAEDRFSSVPIKISVFFTTKQEER